MFAPSVAVSMAAWAAIWLWLGVQFGGRLGRFIHLHHWTYLLLSAGVVLPVGNGLLEVGAESKSGS